MEGDIHEEACFGGGCSARPVCPAATAIAGGRAEREAMGSGQTAGNGGTQSHRRCPYRQEPALVASDGICYVSLAANYKRQTAGNGGTQNKGPKAEADYRYACTPRQPGY